MSSRAHQIQLPDQSSASTRVTGSYAPLNHRTPERSSAATFNRVTLMRAKIEAAAAELLLERRGHPDKVPSKLVFRPKLIVREPCGHI
jgi:hypothetical protein